jgi:hypothetical protein
MFRKADREKTRPLGKYAEQNIGHHISCAYDEGWSTSAQALSWLEDHVGGTADGVSLETGKLLPTKQLAEEAEAAGMWWSAALRWGVSARIDSLVSGGQVFGLPSERRAMEATEKAATGESGEKVVKLDRDTFYLRGLVFILSSFDQQDIHYGPKLVAMIGSEAARAEPLTGYSATIYTEFYPHLVEGCDYVPMAKAGHKACTNLGKEAFDPLNEMTDHVRDLCKVASRAWGFITGAFLTSVPEFDWTDWAGETGEKLVDCMQRYNFEEQGAQLASLYGNDAVVCAPVFGYPLLMQYGDYKSAIIEVEVKFKYLQTTISKPSPTRLFELLYGSACWPCWLHVLGRKQDVARFYDMIGFQFTTVNETLHAW